MGSSAFNDCDSLQTIRLESGCKANFESAGIPEATQIICLSVVLPGSIHLQDLIQLKSVTIPEGMEKICARWFWGSRIESVEIPVSVVEIDADAFRNCKNLQ